MHTLAPRGATHTAPPRHPRTLDRNRLLEAAATRRARVAALEDDLVAECEAAATHATNPAMRRHDRGTWDRAMWERYLARAAALEPQFGPALRRLYSELDQLERLADMPVAA